jgi:putative peptidoglycan lipid II flippase
VDEWLVRYFGATLGVGAITHLSNARKLMLVPASLIGQSVSYAILPSLSNDLAAGRVDEANERMSSSIGSIVALSALAAVALASSAEPIVRTIYQHGAFGAEDAAATASYLRILALAVPGWCLATVASRGFYARQENGRAMVITSAITLLSLPLYGFGARNGAGVGLAWASVAGCTLQGIAIAAALDWRHQTQTVAMTLRGAAAGLLFASPAMAAVYAWSIWGSDSLALGHPWDAAVSLGVSCVAFGLSTLAYVWRSEPLLFAKASKLLRRGGSK